MWGNTKHLWQCNRNTDWGGMWRNSSDRPHTICANNIQNTWYYPFSVCGSSRVGATNVYPYWRELKRAITLCMENWIPVIEFTVTPNELINERIYWEVNGIPATEFSVSPNELSNNNMHWELHRITFPEFRVKEISWSSTLVSDPIFLLHYPKKNRIRNETSGRWQDWMEQTKYTRLCCQVTIQSLCHQTALARLKFEFRADILLNDSWIQIRVSESRENVMMWGMCGKR